LVYGAVIKKPSGVNAGRQRKFPRAAEPGIKRLSDCAFAGPAAETFVAVSG
jgi:hypothetical protein